MNLKNKILIVIAILVIPTVIVVFFLISKAGEPLPFKGRPDIILITAGALRPDHLSPYGYERIKTRALEKLANEGLLFENAYCNVPDPVYSYASILSGKNAGELIARSGDKIELNGSYRPITGYLKEKGYTTMSVIPGSSLPAGTGIDKGFDVFETDILPKDGSVPLASEITKRALELLGKNKKGPVFLWAAYPEPLFPYSVPEGFPGDKDDHPYERQVLFIDNEIAALLKGLDALKMKKNALIVFTSVSGEGLNEHGELTHGILLYNSTAKVPLIVKFPENYMRGRKIAAPVSHIDIVPTILDVLDISPAKPELDGVSMLSPAEKHKNRPLYLESMMGYYEFGWSPAVAVASGDHKYIESPDPELYDLAKDPCELDNIAGKDIERTKKMKETLYAYIEKNRPGILDKLGSGPDPKQNISIARYIYIRVNDPQAAVGLYNKLLSRDPHNKAFKYQLAVSTGRLNNLKKAKRLLLEIVQTDPEFNKAFELLGVIFDQEDRSQAIGYYEKALSINPDMPVSLNNLAWDYAEKGIELDRALEYSERANKLVPGNDSFIDTLNEVRNKIKAAAETQNAPKS